jgi:hypothetical protein
VFKAASLASEDVPRKGDQREWVLMFNPATGTLDFRPDLRSKVDRALRRSVYCFAFRLYLRLSGINLRVFLIERRKARLKAVRQFLSDLLRLSRNRHAQHPQEEVRNPNATKALAAVTCVFVSLSDEPPL